MITKHIAHSLVGETKTGKTKTFEKAGLLFVPCTIILTGCSVTGCSANLEASPTTEIDLGAKENSDNNQIKSAQTAGNVLSVDQVAKGTSSQDLQVGTIEFSIFGLSVKLNDINTDNLKTILGTLIFLFTMQGVLSSYNKIRRNRSTSKALKEAEHSYNKLIDELYDTLQQISPEDTDIIMFSGNIEQQYNVFEKKITEIRCLIRSHWERYEGKVDPKYLAAVQRLYQTTILKPYDINLMKSAADDLYFVGKNNHLLDHVTMNFLEKLSIQISNQK